MPSPAEESEAILAAAQRSLTDQRAGGRRVTGPPIGRRSAALHRASRLRRALVVGGSVLAGLVVVNVLANIVPWVLHLTGWVAALSSLVVLAMVVSALARGAAPAAPSLAQLARAPARQIVVRAQLWLEGQRSEFPPQALPLLGHIGGQLDLLANQLDRIDEHAPAVAQVRALVAEHLPAVVTAYTAIPKPLRAEKHGDASPDEQLTAALTRISTEIDSVTRQLAEGALDQLAIETRFLDMKFGTGAVTS